MTGILSAISGQYSKSLLLGTFFPATVFTLLLVVLIGPYYQGQIPVLGVLEGLDPQWKIIAFLFSVVVVSGLIYNLNITIIQFYEGYAWERLPFASARLQYYQQRYYAIEARQRGMRTLLRSLERSDVRYSGILGLWTDIDQYFSSNFPKGLNLVLRTRLGNVIRSFEDYPFRQYGMDSITLWPRLIGVISKDYAAAIDDAKTSFDFMINGSLLSGVLAVSLALAGVLRPIQLMALTSVLMWLGQVLVLGLLAYALYEASIGRAAAWGTMVKGAFDLYRWQLLKQLGFARVPRTQVEERALWSDISNQMLYGDTPSTPLADYTARSAFAVPMVPFDPAGVSDLVDLETARGISLPDQSGALTVNLQITNVDTRRRTAHGFVVRDALGDGLEYKWGSARRADTLEPINVTGVNPIELRVADELAFNASLILTYRVLPRKN